MSSDPLADPPPLRVLIVGAGVIARWHAEVITRCEGTTLVAVADIDPAAAHTLADRVPAEWGGERPVVYGSLDEALAAEGFDLVSVLTPSGLHAEQSIAALDAGHHVILEKPLDVNVAQARALQAATDRARERGQVCSVISQHRFDPSAVAVRRAIAGDRFGRVVSCVATVSWWRAQSYYDSAAWRGTWAMDGGALMNQGVHTVDLLTWFLGKPVQVFAHTARMAHERIEVEDTAVATVTFASGALAVLHVTTASFPGLTVRIQVHGSQGSAVIDNDQLRYFHAAREDDGNEVGDRGTAGAIDQSADEVGPEHSADATGRGMDFLHSHLAQYHDVVAAVRTGSAPRVRVEDATLALAVVQAVYTSQVLGAPVLVDDVLAGSYDDVNLAEGIPS